MGMQKDFWVKKGFVRKDQLIMQKQPITQKLTIPQNFSFHPKSPFACPFSPKPHF